MKADWDMGCLAGAALLLHVGLVAIPILFWRRRHLDPIRCRRPRLMTMISASAVLLSVHQLCGIFWPDPLEVWFYHVLGSCLVVVMIDGLMLFALSLYVAFNKTRDQLALKQAVTPQQYERLRRAIRLRMLLLTDRFAAFWITSQIALLCLVFIAYAGSVNVNILTDRATDLPLLPYIGVVRLLLSCLAISVIRRRLCMVEDAFGSKSLLRLTLGMLQVGALFFVAARVLFSDQTPSKVIAVIVLDLFVLLAFVGPLRKTYRPRVAAAAVIDLSRVLADPDGFTEFQRHLEKECAVENLLFWRDAIAFRTDCTESAAAAIWARYLTPEAPLEVCLQADLRARLGFGPQGAVPARLHSALFDEAAQHIFLMLEADSFLRFLRTDPRSVQKFMVERVADDLMTDRPAKERDGKRRVTLQNLLDLRQASSGSILIL